MSKREKALKAGIFLLALSLSASCGYFAGSRHGTKTGAEQAQGERKDGERRIAVVDMDEGVKQGGETVQYASKLLPYSGVEYTVTGLQDARNGVETGLYSAYVVIPSDFSRSVQSVNDQPLWSKLAYTIDSSMDDAGKEEAARKVAAMAQNMNDSLTKVYLSSVMKEFHSVQDATGTIIENDERDAEILNSVDAGNLIELVELPELAEIENNVTSLDLAQEYEKNANLVEGLGTAYQEFLQNAQKDLDKTKKRWEEALAETDAAYEALASGKAALLEFSVEKPDMEERYKESRQKLEDAIKAYDSYLEQYNAANAGGNKSALIKTIKEYEEIETKYQDMLNPYLTDSKKDYEFEDVQKYRKELSELLAKELGEDMLADKEEKSWKAYLEWLTEKIDRKSYVDKQASIDNCKDGEDLSDEGQATETPAAVLLSEPLPGAPEGVSTAAKLREQSEKLIAMSEEGQGGLVQEFAEKKKVLDDEFQKIEEKCQAAGKAERETYEELKEYNLASYVESKTTEQIAESFRSNNEAIEGKVEKHAEETDEYIDKVYEAAEENVTAMEKSVEEAQEKSEKLLEEGLREAKKSGDKSRETNLKLLKKLTGQLAYTRIGDVENKEVYDFIAAPLALQEAPEEKVPSGQMADKAAVWDDEEMIIREKSNKKAVWWIAALLAGAIGAALIARWAVSFWRKRRMEEF